MNGWRNVFWLGTKELRSVLSDALLVGFIIFSFSVSIYTEARGGGDTVNNASIAFVDEDRSMLSGQLRNAFYPPYFKNPQLVEATEIDRLMDAGRFMFIITIPPDFESDVRRGRRPAIQISIDATAVEQASLGTGYIRNILLDEVRRFATRTDAAPPARAELVTRRAFNPNGNRVWFQSLGSLLDNLSLIAVVLTGAALLREREHGTIEHLLVMPLTAFQIALAKVWANGLVILVVFTLSLTFVVRGLLDVPFAGSLALFLLGTTLYLFAAAAIGIFLATIARTMAQFSLLMLMVIIPMMMLSGGMSPIESQPDFVQACTWFLPSRHYMAFAQAIVFRGAGLDIVWPQFATIVGLGGAFFAGSLLMFRRSISVAR